MKQLWLVGVLMIVVSAVVSLRIHLRLRARLKTVDGWRARWAGTIKWIYFGANATTFDYQIQWAVLTGELSKSSQPDIRRDAKILRVLLGVMVAGAFSLVRWG